MRWIISVLTGGLVVALLFVVGPVGAAHADTCPVPTYPSPTGSYGELKATHVSCAKAAEIAQAFYSCRTKNGQTGRCVKKVKGYSCQEERTTLSDFYAAVVTCQKNRKKVKLSYRENFRVAA